MPLYVVGLMGMTRRMQHYDVPAWHPWLLVAALGAAVILAGIVCQVAQLVVSIREREQLRDETGDPWDGPLARMVDVFAAAGVQFRRAASGREQGRLLAHEAARWPSGGLGPKSSRDYKPIEMPRNSPTGFVCAFFATFIGFAHDLAHLVAGRAWPRRRLRDIRRLRLARPRPSMSIPAEEVARIDRANRRARGEALATAEAVS